MTALLAVEVRRVFSRRLVRVSVALAVLALLAGAAIAFLVSRDMDQAVLAQAEAVRQAQVQQCITGQVDGVPAGLPAQQRAEVCEQHISSPIQDRRFHYESLPGILEGMSWFAILLGWLLGASLVGAEWHAGTMATLLTWEPRRVRILLAKLVAAGALAFTLAMALQLLLGAALLPAGLWRGTTDGIDADWMRSVSGVSLRVAAVAVVGALIGFSIAAISRNTAAALGIAFGYFAIVENAIRGLRPRWTPWLLGDNLAVVITNQPQNFPLVDHSALGAATLVGCYTLALLVAAVATFRRRDIT
jgi:ABC-type transport system involved in multi-copper enzyme maturation permease subunit